MTKQPYRTGDRVEYIGTPYVVGRGQFCRAIGYYQREHPRPHDGRG